jgi:hypothetical protein
MLTYPATRCSRGRNRPAVGGRRAMDVCAELLRLPEGTDCVVVLIGDGRHPRLQVAVAVITRVVRQPCPAVSPAATACAPWLDPRPLARLAPQPPASAVQTVGWTGVQRHRETMQPEQLDVVARVTGIREIRHDLADDAGDLKPCPEQGDARRPGETRGCTSIRKCLSGVLVNMHVARLIVGPLPSGVYRVENSRSSSSSSSRVPSNASGSTSSSRWWYLPNLKPGMACTGSRRTCPRRHAG